MSQQFDGAYQKLNKDQKQAVDSIDGPVMVIAGPGTGKTQLLSVRVANILKKTDTKPNNILCLTFTDAAANEMRTRLVSLIGQEGYDVNVQTFHSFGSEIIGRFSEFFYSGAHMQPIDDVTSYSILLDIFSKLKHDSPLYAVFNDEYTYLKDTQTAIGQLKKAAVTPEELRALIKDNQQFVDFITPRIIEAFGTQRLSKKTLPALEKLAQQAREFAASSSQDGGRQPLSHTFTLELEEALVEGTTPPVSEFKRKWIAKNSRGELELKDITNNKKNLALADVYETYQQELDKQHLFDYDDMVMNVVRELSTNVELKAELQEQYLYLLVDEFQDTNDAQIKLLSELIDNPVNERRPNVLVVGDDDQAIYKFQGAEVTNMHEFSQLVDEPKVISLSQIYRYPDDLLSLSTSVVEQVSQRVADSFEGVSKELEAVPSHSFELSSLVYPDESSEMNAIAQQIKQDIDNGTSPENIAVIGRQHSHLEQFSVFASYHDLPISYERRDDVLEQPKIKELIHFAKMLIAVGKGKRRQADSLMPELLSFRFWNIKPARLWQLNRESRSNKQTWLDTMLVSDDLKDTAELILDLAQAANNEPLTATLDLMIGAPLPGEVEGGQTQPRSPFYEYYFGQLNQNTISQSYTSLIADVRTIRQKLVQYSDRSSNLSDLLKFIDLQQQAGARIVSNSPMNTSTKSVQLISAHKAKGLEFDNVYIINAADSVWGAGKRGRSSLIKFPANLPIAPAGDNQDDRIRLLYVALTRAKKKLVLSRAEHVNGKNTLEPRMLEDKLESTSQEVSKPDQLESFIIDWTAVHKDEFTANKELLRPYLENYKLSISDLQKFVDVIQNGPNSWMIFNLLRFPGPQIPPAAYGSAVHATLNEAQRYLSNKKQPKKIELLIHDFEESLESMSLSKVDHDFYLDRGKTKLEQYLKQNYASFSPDDLSEVSMFTSDIVIAGAKVTGLLDKITLDDGSWDKGSISIVDYKTGKPLKSWKGSSDFDKIKSHQYKQQLMFYELMTKNSPRFKALEINQSYLEFVEPTENGEVEKLVLQTTDEDYDRLEKLIAGVWKLITELNLPDISSYEQSLAGVIKFEDDIIKLADR